MIRLLPDLVAPPPMVRSRLLTYPESVLAEGEPIAARVAAAAARTVAAGTARLFAAWCTGSPIPEVVDRRCDGVTDFAARRARVSQAIFFTDRYTALDAEHGDDDPSPREHVQEADMIFDGAKAYIHVGDSWTSFPPADPSGPLGPNDPLWPLDALFGASDDAVEIGPEAVRGVPATRCDLTIDLARADAALTAGVSVPSGPYRFLRHMPAQVWLDADGLARRIAVISDPTDAADSQVWSIKELWDFGVAVDIALPGPYHVLAPREAYRRAYEEGPGA